MDLKNKYFGKTKEEAAKKKIDIKKENKQIFDAVKQFERNEIATVQGKAKFITRIAVVLLISNIALAAAIAFLSPLKTAVPFVIRVDNNTAIQILHRNYQEQSKPIRKRKQNIILRSLLLTMSHTTGRLSRKCWIR
ncbi:conjugal transfer protein TraG [Escherichia coli]|nr:conjugal transfer protein TraG [Escherichia coli]